MYPNTKEKAEKSIKVENKLGRQNVKSAYNDKILLFS